MRLRARHGRGSGTARACLYVAAPGALQRAIRIAGKLVSDAALEDAFEHVERVNAGTAITVFEVITAVAFHLFARTPADMCVLEVGLGGRGDATNVIARPAACAITSISLDHREMLGDTLALIAAEKAGIMKPGVPVAIGAQPAEVLDVLLASAERVRSARAAARPRLARWPTHLCQPSLAGAFQFDNAGIAIAALRASGLPMDVAGIASAEWPARLQRLHGRLAATAAVGLGAVAGRWPQSRWRAGSGRASSHVVGSANSSGRRHETVEGRSRIPAAAAAAGRDRLGCR